MPDEIEIRPITASEYAAAGEATARAYSEFLTPDRPGFTAYQVRIADVGARADQATVLVALIDGAIAGSATLELDSRVTPTTAEPLDPDEAHLRMLGVSPEHRGHGIGRLLVAACIEVARDMGKRRLTLDTSPRMVAAQRLYTTMGFTFAGERRMSDGGVLVSYTLDVGFEAPASR